LAARLTLSYGTAVHLEPGLGGSASLIVGDDDTAERMGSGSVPALCEEASCRALDGVFDESKTSVNVRVQFDHLAPLKPGSTVTADALLERVEGKRLTFTVTASDAAGLVGAGRLTRVVVDVASFLDKAR
jgi:fluoroacetyl-CoA thioesterase